MFIQLGLLDAVELQRIVDDALAELVVLGKAVLDPGELVRVLNSTFQDLQTFAQSGPISVGKSSTNLLLLTRDTLV